MTLEVIELQNQGDGFKKISERAPPMGIEFISNGNFRSFQSRERITQEVKDIVKGGDFHMIGICGLGGVGKTTLIKEVGKWAKEEKLFDDIVMVVVSRNSVLSNIQVELAEKLGLTFTVTTFGARAGPLRNRLLQSSGRNLVILDDVWECIDLNEIGIPVGDDDKKTTIVLTSRSEEVCQRLGCNKIIRVDVLSEKEAWSLFRETAGDDTVDACDFYLTASSVAKECGGLPIAIVTVGSALKGKQIQVWKDALLKLSQSIMPANLLEVEAKVFKSLQISYDQVNCEDKEAGSIFLLCCLYHEDANIPLEELVRLGMGKKLFQGIKLVMEARDRVHALIEKLRKCFLLLDGDHPLTVKMHDVVRDVGIWIASEKDHFKMMAINSGRWPDTAYEHCKAISVRTSEITELPSGGLNCPALDILHMSCNSLSIEKLNAGNMLEGMNKLKVLSMLYMSISSLPSSLRLLTNLRVLNLEYISSLRDVSSISEELVNLEILSLRGCESIKNVPREMGRLTNLRVLDMRGCRVKSISPGVISSMCRLEELYTESWLWDEKGNASLNELESLGNLTILMTKIRCSKFLPKDLVFEKLKRYYIKFGSNDFENHGDIDIIRDIRDISNYPFVAKALFLCLDDGTEAPIRLCGIGKLLKESAERVWLKGNELVIALDELAAGGFRHLKELRIRDCDNKVVEYVANYSSTAVFTKLERLDLDKMSHLKAIVSCCHDGKPGGGFFGNLKEIRLRRLPELTHLWKHDPTIHPQACAIKLSSLQFVQLNDCKNVKYLFTQSEAASLENLETLEIDKCEKMEAVILENLGPTNNNVIMLPNLKRLSLCHLNSLICFGNVIEFPQLRDLTLSRLRKHAYVQSIFNQKAMFPSLERLELCRMASKELWGRSQDPSIFFRKLKSLSVFSFTKIENIIPSNSAQYFSGLMELNVGSCPLLEEVFESTGVNIGGADADHLNLFTNLTQICVISCDRLKSLFSSSVARNLPNLNVLVIIRCGSMEEVIGKEEGVEEDGRIGETIFPELRTLDLIHLPRLKRFCPVNSHLKLPDGLRIYVNGCPKFHKEKRRRRRHSGIVVRNNTISTSFAKMENKKQQSSSKTATKKQKVSNESDLLSKSRPQGLFDDVVKEMSTAQKEDVSKIGFGGLLEMKINYLPLYMLGWLVNRFNGTSRMLNINDTKQFVITADDVCDIFLLPRNSGRDVLVLKRNESTNMVADFKERCGILGNTSVSFLKSLLLTRFKEGGDDFKRLFVLFSLASFLAPSSNYTIDFSCLKSLMDVDGISQLDWCSFVLDRLCKSVSKYNNKSSTQVNGCVMVLQIAYFHRLKWKGNAEPSIRPLIQHWTTSKIRNRIKEERSAGKFGQGEWVDTYPISGKVVVQKEKNMPSCGEDEDDINFCLPKGQLSDAEIHEHTNETFEGQSYIKFALPRGQLGDADIHKLSKDNVHETCLLLKRDMTIVSDFYMDRLLKMKKKMPKQSQFPFSTQSPIVSQTQNFFSDDKVLKFIDDVVEKFTSMKNLYEEMPSFDLLPSDNLTSENEGENKGQDKDIGGIVNSIIEELDLVDDADCDGLDEAMKLASSTHHGKSSQLYGCLLLDDCEIAAKTGYISSFMSQNKRLMVEMDIREKQILDFCFFDVKPFYEMDIFFAHGALTISKKEILSLNQREWIYTNVIDAWVLIMNKAQENESGCKRIFFDLTHSFYLSKILEGDGEEDMSEKNMRSCWESCMPYFNQELNICDMIFVPIHLKSHFFCAAVNFIHGKIHLLDNRLYEDPSFYVKSVKVVQKQLAVFLDGRKHAKANLVDHYEIEIVKFPWQSPQEANDCGIFLMHHLEFFKGDIIVEMI